MKRPRRPGHGNLIPGPSECSFWQTSEREQESYRRPSRGAQQERKSIAVKKGQHEVPIDVMLFADGVQGIGQDLIGAYWILCCFIYARDGKTVRDDKWLGGWLGCSTRMASSLTDRLISLGKIYPDGIFLRNHKCDEVCDQMRFARVSAKKNGRDGAEKRWGSKKNNGLQMRPPMHARAREKDNINTTDINIDSPLCISPHGKREGEPDFRYPWKHQISADAGITDEEKKFALDAGFDSSEVDRQWERFKNYHRSEGTTKMDWTSAWKNWVTSPFTKGQKHGTAQRTSTVSRAQSYLQRAREEMPE